jgi:hypothetical protein
MPEIIIQGLSQVKALNKTVVIFSVRIESSIFSYSEHLFHLPPSVLQVLSLYNLFLSPVANTGNYSKASGYTVKKGSRVSRLQPGCH